MEYIKIKEFAKVVSGSTPKTNVEEYWNGQYPWITPAELDKNTQYIYETRRKLTDLGVKSANLNLLKKGSVLLTSRAPIGKVAIAGIDLYCNQGFKNLVCNEQIIVPQYLYYWLSSKVDYLNSLGRGATFKEISKSIVEEIEVPIHKLEIQQKIATILDKAQSLIDKRKEQIEACDELVKSLFYEMFGDPVKNDKGWESYVLEDVTNFITYGLTIRPNYVEIGVPLISAKEIKCGKVDLMNAANISEEDFNSLSDKARPQKGEILFSKTGSIGHCAYIEVDTKFAVTQNAARISLKNTWLNGKWMLYYLRTHYIQQLSNNLAKGNAVRDLQIQDMKKLPIMTPPLHLQNKFAAQVEKIEQQKQLLEQSLAELENNFNSLMQRAFKGELF